MGRVMARPAMRNSGTSKAQLVMSRKALALLAIAQWVPTYDFIAIARSVLMPTQSVDPIVWIAASVWAVGALVVGFVWFWAAEERYGRGL